MASEARMAAFDAEAWRRSLATRATAAAQVHERLRDDILALALPPGVALSENDLARHFGVSRTPVREALLRLADEDLVEIVPKSGSRVSRIPVGKLMEAIVVRRALEEVAVRQAAERASRSQLTGLRAILERQREAEAAGDHEAFHHADEAFHAAIAEAAGYPGLWALVRQVKFQVDRLRRLTLPFPGRIGRAIEEHAAVAEALERHDAAAALAAMNFHLGGLEASLPDLRQQNPDYFILEHAQAEFLAGEGVRA
ncbi:GntR family transcriptional regulator [Ferrovibrio sp.]|uniref:GntR family transcriptional regulator n=1 Tax=Ferrovibrio sp. TaxID=1917215 RepID=UPI0025B8786A|nr:GntR family transcriptional regulator [Ferrovibrio sp.]MBX3454472.1 GntR family transcriptional regulator [Ferrovibrio sp.]